MMTFRSDRVLAVAAVAALLIASPAEAADTAAAQALAGHYELKGTNPDGTKYEGTVDIEYERGTSVKLTYQVLKRKDIGLGQLASGTLTVTYQGAVANRVGKATYEVGANGHLTGTWHDKGGKPGHETLTKTK